MADPKESLLVDSMVALSGVVKAVMRELPSVSQMEGPRVERKVDQKVDSTVETKDNWKAHL